VAKRGWDHLTDKPIMGPVRPDPHPLNDERCSFLALSLCMALRRDRNLANPDGEKTFVKNAALILTRALCGFAHHPLGVQDLTRTGLWNVDATNMPGYMYSFNPPDEYNDPAYRDAHWVAAEKALQENVAAVVERLPRWSDINRTLANVRRLQMTHPAPSAVISCIPSRSRVQAAQMFVRLATRLNRNNDQAVQERVDLLLWTLINENDPIGVIKA